ncbi:glycoside hydrolase family 2 TIM barrel-domain containing protein [Dyadobacter pollutisoli]|uniref:Glycoside hydrolase family 2 catalytic domain-containing protein n=1 Tax=Dyadobacter pollutisoli TaxID=2910158 RepID=A0A9E8SIU4_9BACT|nr:glycoside hydrolase family 2 TIM barrel-domain containing protein [Dyadobacter pollutisoli]WAC10173.1 hypothetical protein ON006_20720 [Dyadobacter pollutisoli]
MQKLLTPIRKLYPFLLLIVFVNCSNPGQITGESNAVSIRQENGKYAIYRAGKPFTIKGAAGFSHFNELKQAGGNTLRTWDTTHLQQILDSARANGIAVIVGLPIPNNNDIKQYQDTSIVRARYQALQSLVRKYKDSPAILMWCLGNELDFPYKLIYRHFYEDFNNLTSMIHREDPGHPITTTVLNFNPKYIANIQMLCDIDVISFNIFSNLKILRDDLAGLSWFWRGPYLLLEWGIDGPWTGSEETAWGAFIENTSKKKAEVYLKRYQQEMPVEDPRFLGACVFFWGHKQETTHTWFSIFDQTGESSEAVGSMQHLWTGKPSTVHYPDIQYMLLNQKGARDNIILNPATAASAEVLMFTGHDDVKSVKWELFKEDWYKENQMNSIKKLRPLNHLIEAGNGLHTKFVSPSEEGPYRLFATVYDHNGHFASCNTPFYVVSNK